MKRLLLTLVLIITFTTVHAQPHSEFLFSAESNCINSQVDFLSLAYGGVVTWDWDFGDGATSNKINPEHTYNQVGTFTITLTVTDHDGLTDTYSDTHTVRPPGADFTASPILGNAISHTVFFTDNSTLPDTWEWDFGDGNTSTLQNPVHSYTTTGAFEVKLTVSDTIFGCLSTEIREDLIKISIPVANFTGNGSDISAFGCVPLTVDYIDTSTGDGAPITEWDWDFGDGTTSTQQNPTHVYENIGVYNVSLTVTDAFGNKDTLSRPFFTEATGPDVDFSTPDPTIGCAPLTITFVDETYHSNFPISYQWDFGDGNTSNTFGNVTHTYSTAGTFNVSLTVEDELGCSRTETKIAFISMEDTEAPTAICQNITVPLNALGNVSIDATNIDNGSSDNCGITSLAISPSTFDCSNVGPNNVTLTVTDSTGNSSTCTAVVTVEDNVNPAAICQDITVQLDANGDASIIAADVDGGATDACGIASLAIDNDTFDCSNVGTNNVTLTVTDTNGNTSSCVAIVTVEDTIDPAIGCPSDIIAGTDTGVCGGTVFFPDAVAADACGIVSVVQTAGLPSGSVFPLGSNLVEYTATDVNGNTTVCSFAITVVDDENPIAVCQDITIQLDASGDATIVAADVDGGSTDNCAIASSTIDIDTFDCSNVGSNNVTLTVTDANGNTSSCVAVVTVEDVTAPMAVCQNITVQLDSTGTFILAPALLDGGSADGCGGVLTYSVDIDTFTCADVGDTNVVLTVNDASGNSATCTAVVTVVDTVAPTLVCKDITVSLDENGMASIVAADVIDSVSDACGLDTLGVDISNFDCDDIGTPVTVTVFANDSYGNISTCLAIVTVVDELAPQFDTSTLPDDQERIADANGQYILEDFTTNVSVTDNCSLTENVIILDQDPAVGTVLTVGVYDITLTAEDDLGNVADYTFQLEVTELLGVGNTPFDIKSITLFPNPASDIIVLSNPQHIPLQEVTIYDVTGRLIQKIDASNRNSEVKIDLSKLASATYMVLIHTENGVLTKQLVKE